MTALTAWDGFRAEARAMRWSETAPAVIPKQTVVTVDVSHGDSTTTGIASLTYYVEPESASDGRVDPSLAEWLGAAVSGLPVDADGGNPYDPVGRPLGAAVELAVLDALGRETELPAAAFLGGIRRTRIEAYASLPSFPVPDEAVDCAIAAVSAGFRAVKFHAAGVLDRDLETIEAARRRLGRGVGLMWDASCAYDVYSAVLVGRALSDAGFLWFEAPLADDSSEALRSLAGRVAVPLVPDGLVQRSPADWARDVRDGLWGALRLDVTRTPGVSSAVRLLALAEVSGLPCEIQSFGFPLGQYANLQLMLTTEACRFYETPFPVGDFEDGVAAPPAIVDGFVQAPESPGLGHGVEADDVAERLKLLARVSA